jgi:hypothetical protein
MLLRLDARDSIRDVNHPELKGETLDPAVLELPEHTFCSAYGALGNPVVNKDKSQARSSAKTWWFLGSRSHGKMAPVPCWSVLCVRQRPETLFFECQTLFGNLRLCPAEHRKFACALYVAEWRFYAP